MQKLCLFSQNLIFIYSNKISGALWVDPAMFHRNNILLGKFVSAECPMIGKAPEPVTNGAAKKAAAKDDDDEDDDDVDLFGSDSEDEAAEAEKVTTLLIIFYEWLRKLL